MSKRNTGQNKKRQSSPKFSKVIWIAAIALGGIFAVAYVLWPGSSGKNLNPILEGRVESYPSEGQDHIAVGENATYNTNPPNSGPHYGQPAPPGFYDRPIPDEVVVHNLEHGNVVVFFDPSRLSSDDETYLSNVSKRYTGTWDAVLAVARPEMDHPFVLSAWQHLLRLDSLDRDLVDAFVDAYRGRGPENPVR